MSLARRAIFVISPMRVLGASVSLGLVAFAVFLLVNTGGQAQREVVILCGLLNLVLGVGVFLQHGGVRVSVLGVFSFASALFVGAAGAYASAIQDDRVPMLYLGQAVIAGSLLHVLVWLSVGPAPPAPPLSFLRGGDARWATRWGVGVLLVLVVVETLNLVPALSGFVEGAAVAATIILAVGILWQPDARIISFGTLVVASAFLMYTAVFHSGAGRLRIITLACALLILYTLRFRRVAIKWLVILGTPIALFLLAQQRLSLQESLQVGASAGRNGLESMLVPIVVFGQLLREQAEGFPLAWGSSLLSFPLSVLPESIAPTAPGAFGYELVRIYSPERYGSGYSTAATVGAEAVYNFALPGLLVFAPIIAWLLVLLDRGIILAAASISTKRTSIVSLAFWVTFGGAIADLAWSGQHTFLARTTTRVPLVLLLWVGAAVGDIGRERKDRAEVREPMRRGSLGSKDSKSDPRDSSADVAQARYS